MMMGAVALVALLLLRHIREDLSGRPAGPGLFRQASGVAVGMGMTAALGAGGSAALGGLGRVRRRLGWLGQRTPWERMEAEANNATKVHGAPQPGFDAVPGAAVAVTAGRRGGADQRGEGQAARASGGGDADERPAGADVTGMVLPAGVAPILDGRAGGVESHPSRGRPAQQRTRTRPAPEPPDETPQFAEIDASEVPPMLETGYGHPLPDPEPPLLDVEPPPPPTTVPPDTED
jgi:hypothetical protein